MAKPIRFKVKTSNSPSKQKYKLADNIIITHDQHVALVDYIKIRLDFAKKMHKSQVDRFTAIDKEVAGYMVLDDDDRKRQQDNTRGYGPKVYDVNIPLAGTQMDEAVTFFTTVFFPEEGPYNAVTEASKEDVAKGFSKLMNKQASFYKHFTHFAKGAYSGLKYNLGLWIVEWEETKGSVISNTGAGVGVEVKEDQVVMSGNKLEFANPYNTLLDPSVPPTEVHEKGEFFATVEPKTAFRAQIMAQREEIFNLDLIVDSTTGQTRGEYVSTYYEQMPEIHGDSRRGGQGTSKTNWVNFLSGFTSGGKINGLEFINVYIWIAGKQFGLGDSDKYQIWRITFANMIAVRAVQMTNAHGFLPLVATVPWDDEFGQEANSFAEMLLPYQRFSSFQINVHQRAARKALYNITIYNSRMLPGMANSDALGGKVPFNPTADDNDINKAVKVLSDVPDTSRTLQDIETMDGLMQKILPTDMLKQVASLERATQYQAAATVQGANRRNLKIAKTIDVQAFGIARKIQMYNILQYQQSIEILGDGGEMIQIDPSALREQKMEFAISDGLRGLDKLILVETMKDVIALLVQNPQAAAEFNIADMIDYLTTLIGDHTSFKQFRFINEFDKLTPEQKQTAFQLLQQALTAQGEGQQQPGGAQ